MSDCKEALKATSAEGNAEMRVHQDYPLNVGASAHSVRQKFITEQKNFYIRNHGSLPTVDVQHYRLTVGGLVQTSLELTLDELRAAFSSVTVTATLQCAGHRRDELAAIRAIPGEVIWSAETAGTATWKGVALRDLLQAAGLKKSARHVAFLGLDEISKDGERFGFGGSIPVEKALSSEVLLAYEMNGEPLAPAHGFPVRVVVPGYIGARSVKWLANITLQEEPSSNYYQARAYKLFPPHIRAETADWQQGQMLGPLPINSVICSLQPGAVCQAGQLAIQGYAIAGEDQRIERVELSLDAGASWLEATLTEQARRWAWSFWEASVQVQPGTYQLMVRAWDTAGHVQPENLESIWNWKGYLNNAWQRVTISIE
ncbi:sulfite oxidase [Ktedonosporobacter rubrisoli]|uniref:sulfite oxidase n=1 Tax=Ktedonosporobacter rubrisoli TaxID=2509675 RepID=UPI001F5C1BC9|nr:sulfite oxidase [Ktedonosporobacter rubrisoli]